MPGAQNYITGGATGAGVGAAFGGPLGAGIGAGVGIIGAGLGLFGDDDAAKRLQKKQAEMAEEAKRRQAEAAQQRMQALGQQMLAFNPQNQMMAQMFGPEAAFSPQQMAQMSNDPGARSQADYEEARKRAFANGPDQRMSSQGWSPEEIRRMEANERRKKMVESQTTPLGPGPAPLRLPPPQAARRF